MILGNVGGSPSDFGNNNSGIIGQHVTIGTLVQSNKSTQESLTQRYLETNWPRSPKSAYNADLGGTATREVCTPGTRVDVLKRVYAWAENSSPDSPSVFWLTGDAGSGKSTIAFSVAQHFDGHDEGSAQKILGANFFCSRQFEETRQKKNIIPTIVDQLAHQSQPYANSLLKANKFESVNTIFKQMKDLLVEPWAQSLDHQAELPHFLVIVDALDEIEDRGGLAFLEELLRTTNKFHLRGLKFFITSRPDVDLATLYSSFPSNIICPLHDIPTDTVKSDIATYLRTKLPLLWGTPEINVLMHQADGLFIFAATAVRYITPRPRMEEFEQIQLIGELGIHARGSNVSRNTNASPIDALYNQVMFTAFKGLSSNLLKARLYALHTILCTQERVSTSIVGELHSEVSNMARLVKVVVDELHAVLYVKDGRVLWYHNSFPDFVFSQARSGSILIDSRVVDMHCDEASHHANLAHSCFRIMRSCLRFNICNLPSSFLLDSEVADLDSRIRANISDGLRYSCLHWMQHLAHSSSEDGRTEIRDFLQLKVLFWIEVMNLLGLRARCTPILQQAREYILKGDGGHVSDLTREVREAANFATYFGGSSASQSTPHLYVSSLATWSRDSILSVKWKNRFSRVPVFKHEGSLPLLTIWGKGDVTSVALSNDGTRIVSGSGDEFMRIWDASTGAELRRLDGHSDDVTSVALSSDGTRIVSGSWDKSLRIWDTSTGTELRTLDGHSEAVTSVAFSDDNILIVSGSQDTSVRIWNASTGAELRRLDGHSKIVSSVAFSRDGTRIVSGSHDESVRVWNSLTGKELRRLDGHSDHVYSVAFSNDGTRIASGAGDMLVRVWDPSTGKELMKLNGHSDDVTSVAFSSDGTRIVSGSGDMSVRVWDASKGVELRSLVGHTKLVRSVVLSSDGTRIVSGSKDTSVRVWDALTVAEARRPKCHSDWVTSVALSSDGTRIVSGSRDQSVRIWDALTGVELLSLVGHSDWVTSVAFSSDDTRIVSGSDDKTVRVWDAYKGAELKKLKGHSMSVSSVAISSDGTRIVSGSYDKSVRVWGTSKRTKTITLDGHTDPVYSVALSSDGTRVVSGSGDKSVRIWSASTGVELKKLYGHSEWVYSVAFSSDGTRIASGSYDKSVRVWNSLTGKELRRLDGHSDHVYSVAFSNDGTRIVSGSGDESVRIWDASTGVELLSLVGHTKRVWSVAFSSDDTCIVSGSQDTSVRIWDVAAPIPPWELSSDGGWILSTPHQQRLMCVPQEVLKVLNRPRNLLSISSKPIANVDFTNSQRGPAWIACYTPSDK